MPRLLSLTTLLLFVFTAAVQAQAWVQVEAQPTLAQAEGRARAYARDFPNVNGYQLRSGWYAIALGPFSADQALSELQALRAERLIPGDSFVADGAGFVRQFWPVGGAQVVAPPVPDPGVETTVLPEPGSETGALPEPGGEAEAAPLAPVASETAEVVPVVPVPDETPSEARRSEADLDRPAREMLQTALKWEGFYSAAIDGAFGPGTRAAMEAWQVAKGYEPTGVLTTLQRNALVEGYRQVLSSLGMQPVRDNTAGIEVDMPTGMVSKGEYQPPFAYYDGDQGVRVILISQSGDQDTLYGLYDILQTLEVIPLNGERERGENQFRIDGANAEIVSHAEARLTPQGAIKGFILVWPTGDEKRRALALSAMQASFTPIPDAVLPDTAGGGEQSLDLLSGLEIRRPEVARSGFYFDASGLVLTSADAVASCGRITLDEETAAKVIATDPGLGIAVLQADVALAPLGFARFQPGMPRLQSEVAVSGYSYDGRLGAPVLTFGRLADVKGLEGEDGLSRLALNVTPGDAGGPVFDGSGAVVGLLLPAEQGDRVLPDDVSFAADAVAIAEFLSKKGFAATAAEPSGDLAPEDLARLARDMTVQVSCWN
jgi:peptidoglycan hydrolase-like protein with peptidoglycan-binding domain